MRDPIIVPNQFPFGALVQMSGAVRKKRSQRDNNLSSTARIPVHAKLSVDVTIIRHLNQPTFSMEETIKTVFKMPAELA